MESSSSTLAEKDFGNEEKFIDSIVLGALRKAGIELGRDTSYGMGENEWHTPEKYIEAARKVLGEIDLDPASSDIAQDSQGQILFTAEQNGLNKEWRGKVWLNPPDAQPLGIWRSIEKLVDELVSGKVTEAILLTHNYSDTAWWHKAESIAELICFVRGRIKFVDEQEYRMCADARTALLFITGTMLNIQ